GVQFGSEAVGGGGRPRAVRVGRGLRRAGVAGAHASATAVAGVRASATSAAGPRRLGLTSPTAPFTQRAGTRKRRSSSRAATPMTSPEYLRLRAPRIVPWIA